MRIERLLTNPNTKCIYFGTLHLKYLKKRVSDLPHKDRVKTTGHKVYQSEVS